MPREQWEHLLRDEDANLSMLPELRIRGAWISSFNPATNTGIREMERIEEDATSAQGSGGGEDAGGPGIVLNVTLAGQFHDSLTGEHVEVDIVGVDENDEELRERRFTGRVVDQGRDGGDTTLICATGGYDLDKIKFNQRQSFQDWKPERVVKFCESKCGYDHSRLVIEDIPIPTYRRADEEGNTAFGPWEAVGAPLVEIADMAGVTYRDTSHNGFTCRRIRRYGASERSFDISSLRLAEAPHSDASDGPIYNVVVYRETEDGAAVRLAGALVDGSTADENATLWIQVTDSTPLSTANARQLARDWADKYSPKRRMHTFSERVIDPFLTRGKWITLREYGTDDAGDYLKEWHSEIVGIKDTFGNRQQEYTLDSRQVRETRIEPEEPEVDGLTGVVLRPRIRYSPYDQPELEDQPWVTVLDHGTFEINMDAAFDAGVAVSVDTVTNEWVIDLITTGSAPDALYPGDFLYPSDILFPQGEG